MNGDVRVRCVGCLLWIWGCFSNFHKHEVSPWVQGSCFLSFQWKLVLHVSQCQEPQLRWGAMNSAGYIKQSQPHHCWWAHVARTCVFILPRSIYVLSCLSGSTGFGRLLTSRKFVFSLCWIGSLGLDFCGCWRRASALSMMSVWLKRPKSATLKMALFP